MLRKAAPYLIFIAIGVLFWFSQVLTYDALVWLAVHVRHLSPVGSPDEASPAVKWAEEQLSGWPSVGRATGKLIMAAAFYVLSSILPWLIQKLTHPAVARWKATCYSAAFDALPTEQQFAQASWVDSRAAFRIALCILAAALIN